VADDWFAVPSASSSAVMLSVEFAGTGLPSSLEDPSRLTWV
jgi:hypothetical protein